MKHFIRDLWVRGIWIMIGLLCASLSLLAQSPGTVRPLDHVFKRIQSHDLFWGYHLQGGDEGEFMGPNLHYLEVGYARTLLVDGGHHGPTSFIHYLSQEIPLNGDFVTATKIGALIQGGLLASAGVAAVFYTDFTQGSLKIRPEFGLGGGRFRMVVGFNLPIFNNDALPKVSEAKYQFSVQYSLPFAASRTDPPKSGKP